MASAVGENGATTAADFSSPLPAVSGAGEGTPPAPLPPSPPQRICFAQNRVVHNPVISFQTPEPLCGQATRKEMLDAVTFEKDMVTCEKCKAILSGETKAPRPEGMQPGAPPATAKAQALVGDSLKALMDQLDVEKLKERQLDLEGELAAVKILLEAAMAREAAKGK